MKVLSSIPLIIILLSVINLEVRAQNQPENQTVFNNSPIAVEQISDSSNTDSDLILGPVVDHYWMQNYIYDRPERLMKTGIYVNRYGIGAEYTLRPTDSRYYIRIFTNAMMNPEERIPDASFIAWSGVTIGYETVLHSPMPNTNRGFNVLRAEVEGTQFYARIGPGFGAISVARTQGGVIDIYPGVHAATTVGAFRSFGNQSIVSAFYIEMGGEFGAFPGLQDLTLIGSPRLTIGFMLFGNQRIAPFRI